MFIKGGEDDLDPVTGQYTGLAFGYGGGDIYNNGAILWEFTTTAANGKLHFAVNPTGGDGTANLSDSKMTILDYGNVGIGTTSPSSKFQVEGAPANGVYLSYLYNSATHNSANGLNVQTSSNNILTYGLRVNTAGDSNALAVMGNGSVGIGTGSPSEKLTLQLDAQNQAFSGKNGTDYLWFLRNEAGAGARQSGRFQLMDTDVTTVNIESASNRNTYFNAGNVAIGTVTPDQTGYGYKVLTIMGGTTAGYAGTIELLAPSVDAEGQNYGILSFGAGGTRTAMISANRQAANNAGNLRFWTSPGGAGIQER